MESLNTSNEKTDLQPFLVLCCWVPHLHVPTDDMDLPFLIVPWSSMASNELGMLVHGGVVVYGGDIRDFIVELGFKY